MYGTQGISLWYQSYDDRRILVHTEEPSYGYDTARFARCGKGLAEPAPPLIENDTRRLCPTCGLSDDELATTQTRLHRTQTLTTETATKDPRGNQAEIPTCPGWGEECGNQTAGSDLCPDCHMGRLNAQSPRTLL